MTRISVLNRNRRFFEFGQNRVESANAAPYSEAVNSHSHNF